MLTTVLKLALNLMEQPQTVSLPKDAEVVNVLTQHGMPLMLAISKNDEEKSERTFQLVKNSGIIPENGAYVGSFLDYAQQDIFHVFEIVELSSLPITSIDVEEAEEVAE